MRKKEKVRWKALEKGIVSEKDRQKKKPHHVKGFPRLLHIWFI